MLIYMTPMLVKIKAYFNNEKQNNVINVKCDDQAYIIRVNKTVTFSIINQMFTQ